MENICALLLLLCLYVAPAADQAQPDSQDDGLSFSPITLRFVIVAKFEIE
jgi:hypothetical protein